MKPKRPDSAKSAATKITQYSQQTHKDLNVSKFSETFTSGVNHQDSKNNDFAEYVRRKDKDPKFKNLLQPIKQQTKKPQASKVNTKPFEKKNSKVVDKSKKTQQEFIKKEKPTQQKQQQQQNLNKSQRFADKNKKKFSSLKIQQITDKVESENHQKVKLNFNGFSVNVPGKKPVKQSQRSLAKKNQASERTKSPQKAQNGLSKKIQMTKQQCQDEQNRQNLYKDLSKFIEDTQIRNTEYYPQRYDQFIDTNTIQNAEDLDKINIDEYLKTPTQIVDYAQVSKRIKGYDRRIEDDEKRQKTVISDAEQPSSIDLSRIIESSQNNTDKGFQESRVQSQAALTSMTASDFQKRNLFLTEILKGKITKNQIEQLQIMERTSYRCNEMEQEQSQYQDDIDIYQVDMKKRTNNRIMQRNRIQASGQVYRDCDYLSQEYKERLQKLLNGQMQRSPFEHTQSEVIYEKRLNEGIQLYRRIYTDQNEEPNEVINESVLPKDPLLKKEAELKILKQKMNSVNQRLREVDKVVVNKTKIEMMVEKYKKTTKISKASQDMLKQKDKQFQQQNKNVQEAERILALAQRNYQSIQRVLQQMNERFNILSHEVLEIRAMDEQQMRQYELSELRSTRQNLEKRQRQFNQIIQVQMRQFQRNSEQMRQKLKVLNQIGELQGIEVSYENYNPNETVQTLDKMISQRWQAAENISRKLQIEHTQQQS